MGKTTKHIDDLRMRVIRVILKRGGYDKNSNGPFRLGATHGRQAPQHPSGQQPRGGSGGHPVIDEVAIHRHPASCNIGASLRGQLSVLSWVWVCSTLPHHLVIMLTSDKQRWTNSSYVDDFKSNHLNKCYLNQNHFVSGDLKITLKIKWF